MENGEGNKVQFDGNEVHEFVFCGERHYESSEIYSLPGVLNWETYALKSEGTAPFSDHLGQLNYTIWSDAIIAIA